MNSRHLIVATLAAGLAACASTSPLDKKAEFKSADQPKRATLEVPPDLTAPTLNNNYVIPAGGISARDLSQQQQANASDTVKQASSQVLSGSNDTRIERAGSQRWLVVSNRTADQLWPQLREFWQDNGFVLKRDEPQIGIMETDWAENRAKVPLDGLRNLLGKVGLDGLYSTPERDKFRTRIERNANGIEVYISHRGMIETFTEGKNDTKWQPRDADPELEAEMLGRLMLALGADAEKAKEQVKAAQDKPASQRARLSNGQITIDDGFDRAWRRTGLALDRVGLVVTDRDRSQGIYFVRPAKSEAEKADDTGGFWSSLAFWRDKSGPTLKDGGAEYRIQVRGQAQESQISVLSKDGAQLDARLRDTILQKLEPQLR